MAGSSRRELLEMVGLIHRARQLAGMIVATEAACPSGKRSELERQRDNLGFQLANAQVSDIGKIKEAFNTTSDAIRGLRDIEKTLEGRRINLADLRKQHAELLSV
jgi:hypothetical protein